MSTDNPLAKQKGKSIELEKLSAEESHSIAEEFKN